MRIHVTYADVSDFIESGGRAVQDTHDETIHLPFAVGRVLAAGEDAIDLGGRLRRARLRVAGIGDPGARDTCGWRALVMAVDDLTKTGSDEVDGFLGNPQYGRADAALCSEFVSWYYHEAGLVLAGDDLAGIESTGALHKQFGKEDRMIPYDPVYGDFRTDPEALPYEPQPGDFLEWRKYDAGYHSMMLLDYDPATSIARVINGPWPVRISTVNLQAWSQVLDDEGAVVFTFWIGNAQK